MVNDYTTETMAPNLLSQSETLVLKDQSAVILPNCANPVSPSLSTISISSASPRGYETVTVTL